MNIIARIVNTLRPGRVSLSDHYGYLAPAPEKKKIAEKRSQGLYLVKPITKENGS